MSIITFPLSELNPVHPHLRRFNPRYDLRAISNLVEKCFDETLDAEGRRTIQQMRSAAGAHAALWRTDMGSESPYPFGGFVREQDGALIGNLSLIPIKARGRRITLVANVAVHPDYRRRGIARKLTEAALEDCKSRRCDQIWLHVREDNPGALDLYRQLGFIEKARRTSWDAQPASTALPLPEGLSIGQPRRRHWQQHLAWLDRQHPESLDWHLSLNAHALRPGLAGHFHRLLTGASVRQWAATRDAELLGIVSWQRTGTATDRLWLAVPLDPDEIALAALLRTALSESPTRKTLRLDFQAGRATGAIENAGFALNHTLIWMQYGG